MMILKNWYFVLFAGAEPNTLLLLAP